MVRLEKYKGKASRFTCPNCSGKHEFTRYVGDDGDYIHDTVGKCNRVSKCGYHYTPRQYYADFPMSKTKRCATRRPTRRAAATPVLPAMDFIDESVLQDTLTGYEDNALVQSLLELFADKAAAVEEAIRKYLIGTSASNRTVFWQIDQDRKIRTGKVIAYEAKTGKRIKTENASWMHTGVKKDFHLKQCFFGEHLLIENPDGVVAIVEAEKTAVIASIMLPEFTWVAVGGVQNLSVGKLERIGERTVILYPDGDAFGRWSDVADAAVRVGLDVRVSKLIETDGAETEKVDGYDIADYLVGEQKRIKRLNRRPALAMLPDDILTDDVMFAEFETILEERISIFEYCGGLSEAEAEAAAFESHSLDEIVEAVRASAE